MNHARRYRDDMERGQFIRDRNMDEPTPVPLTTPEEQARLDEQAKAFPVTRLPYMGERPELKWPQKRP